jgi:methionyl-tRNA synthetase
VDDRKVSKSLGNMVSPLAMRERYGFEAFRYFLLREMSFGLDASFAEEALVERVNADLANNLGNLVSRTLQLVERFCAGRVPDPGALRSFTALAQQLGTVPDPSSVPVARVEQAMESLQVHLALAAIVDYASGVNRFLDAAAPWKRVKDPAQRATAEAALYHACQALRALALLLAPFLPGTARGVATRLGVPDLLDGARLPEDARAWDGLAPGTPVAKGAPLFPRLAAPAEA